MILFQDIDRVQDRLKELKKIITKTEALSADSIIIENAIKERLNDELYGNVRVGEDWKSSRGDTSKAIRIRRDNNGNFIAIIRLDSYDLKGILQNKLSYESTVITFRLEIRYQPDNTYIGMGMATIVAILPQIITDIRDGAERKDDVYQVYHKLTKTFGNDTSELEDCMSSIIVEHSLGSESNRVRWFNGSCMISKIQKK